MQYDGEMSGHYSSMDGIGSPVYDPATAATAGHHAARATAGPGGLPLQPSAAALPRSPAYSPHPSAATGSVSSLASPYSGAPGGGGYPGSTSAAAAAMNAAAASSSAAAVAAVDSLLKRDKDAIYRPVHYSHTQLS